MYNQASIYKGCGVEQMSSNIAPNYTKKTYEANSYVMQGGVLYTNPNAIGTAEDWNPAHWTQTTVAEMMANAGDSGYTQVNLTFASSDTKTVPVGQKEDIYVECTAKSNDYLILQIAEDCTDAVIRVKRLNNTKFASVQAKIGNNTVSIYGKFIMTGIEVTPMYKCKRLMLSLNEQGDHGDYDVPNDFSEVEMNDNDVISNVTDKTVNDDLRRNKANSWVFVVKGRTVMCLPE